MRKLVSLLLALVMLGTMAAIPAVAESAQDPITVTVFVGEARDQPTSDNKIFKKIEEEFGLKFEFEFLAGDLNETLGVKIAGQDYADLMDGGNSAEKLIEAGALVNLMDYISPEKTPNLYSYIEPYMGRLLDDEGRLYIVPNYGRYYNTEEYGMNYVNGPAFFLQKKVLAWAGYPTIKTMDEYFDLIERYVAANPTNAKGQKNEGFAILCDDWRAFCLFNPVQHLMGRPNDGDVIVDIDNNYKTEAYVIQDYAKPYYKKLNEMYHKGLISQDTFVMNYDQYIAKLSSGTVVGMFDQAWDFNTATDRAQGRRDVRGHLSGPADCVQRGAGRQGSDRALPQRHGHQRQPRLRHQRELPVPGAPRAVHGEDAGRQLAEDHLVGRRGRGLLHGERPLPAHLRADSERRQRRVEERQQRLRAHQLHAQEAGA